jgi:galactonate dehydratase
MKNLDFLELQYGEVPWRGELLTPPERFVNGRITVPDKPGFGVALNDDAVRRRALPL